MTWLTRSWVLYPILAIFSAALIWVSLGPAPDAQAGDMQAGIERDGTVSFDASALAGVLADGNEPMRIVRGFGGRPQAVRLAINIGAPAPSAETPGVRIVLSAERGLALSDKPVLIEVDAEPFAALGVESIAVSLQDGASPVQWVIAPLNGARGVTSIAAPATANVNAIGFRPVTTQPDGPRGLTLYAVRVKPGA